MMLRLVLSKEKKSFGFLLREQSPATFHGGIDDSWILFNVDAQGDVRHGDRAHIHRRWRE